MLRNAAWSCCSILIFSDYHSECSWLEFCFPYCLRKVGFWRKSKIFPIRIAGFFKETIHEFVSNQLQSCRLPLSDRANKVISTNMIPKVKILALVMGSVIHVCANSLRDAWHYILYLHVFVAFLQKFCSRTLNSHVCFCYMRNRSQNNWIPMSHYSIHRLD